MENYTFDFQEALRLPDGKQVAIFVGIIALAMYLTREK